MKNFFLLIVAAFCISACTSGPKVSRESSQEDLSGYWNNNDVKIVCTDLIDQCLNSRNIIAAYAKEQRLLRVMVGTFRNESDEHINTSIISSTMEITLDNSGIFRFVEGGEAREQLRAERQDQLYNASEATAPELGMESAADYILTGSVKSSVDRAGNRTSRSYMVRAELTDIETNERVWSGMNTDINKTVVNPSAKW
ncbi:MAG: penicillin-binding protein activator LpoB [Treponema sp.]|jgi:uncharacterized protein (TIGR02722 family)|nr:penicillin-binding protein activator LpoB [Treponema sp.]